MVSKTKRNYYVWPFILATLWPLSNLQFYSYSVPGDKHEMAENIYTERLGKESSKAVVFYNLFVKNESDVGRVSLLVQEQLSLLNTTLHEEVVYLSSIGVPIPALANNTLVPDVDVRVLNQTSEGTEIDTLHLAWEYCRVHLDQNIVYLHSKGSFHPSTENENLRYFLTRGALSEDCARLPYSCDVCSSRMSPLPHPHTSGNMWLARCSYVNNLMEPYTFREAMGDEEEPCVGSGRFSAEHWVHSHPSVRPCDLATDVKFTWGYANIPTGSFSSQLAPAPRFPYSTYPDACPKLSTLRHRLEEYQRLYGIRPGDSWWGWEVYPSEPSTIFLVGVFIFFFGIVLLFCWFLGSRRKRPLPTQK